MIGTRMRIDASLLPVEAPLPDHLEESLRALAEGAFDSMPVTWIDALVVSLRRARQIVQARFNDHLNSLLAQYGLHVTLVSDPDTQCAVAYGDDYGMTEALDEALQIRDWFLPAALHTWVPPVEAAVALPSAINESLGVVPAPR